MKTAVAVFTYNRPEHARRLLDSLAGCSRLDECDIFIYSDAPRIPEHIQGAEQTRALIQSWGGERSAQIILRQENWGLARSIVSGVTELCVRYGRVIVLEDDLVLHPDFIHYMLSALDRYEHEQEVVQISGYMFPVGHPAKPDAFFLPLTTTWGWATWQRVWKDVDWNARGAAGHLNDADWVRRFDLDHSYGYSNLLRERLRGANQSWAILFYWWVFSRGMLALHPRRTFVYNSGMDGSGYHSSNKWTSGYGTVDGITDAQRAERFDFPAQVDADRQAYRRIQAYLAGIKPDPWEVRRRSLMKKIANFFGRKA